MAAFESVYGDPGTGLLESGAIIIEPVIRGFVLVVGIATVEVRDNEVRSFVVMDKVTANPFEIGSRRAIDRSIDGIANLAGECA